MIADFQWNALTSVDVCPFSPAFSLLNSSNFNSLRLFNEWACQRLHRESYCIWRRSLANLCVENMRTLRRARMEHEFLIEWRGELWAHTKNMVNCEMEGWKIALINLLETSRLWAEEWWCCCSGSWFDFRITSSTTTYQFCCFVLSQPAGWSVSVEVNWVVFLLLVAWFHAAKENYVWVVPLVAALKDEPQ